MTPSRGIRSAPSAKRPGYRPPPKITYHDAYNYFTQGPET
jgi:hypothetical protein